jgi:deazaflavin-dependent oxidoreductase (nitroreductase family)
VSDYNRRIIETFRANGGEVGGQYAGMPLLLLTTTGRRTGRPHTTPLAYLAQDGDLVVFASKGGAPTNPDWFHNLRAHPVATVEVGADRFEARARITAGEERARLFALQAERRPQFAGYAAGTSREIPVVVLSPAGGVLRKFQQT